MGSFFDASKVLVSVLTTSDGCIIGVARSSLPRGDAGERGVGCGVEKSDWTARLNRPAAIVRTREDRRGAARHWPITSGGHPASPHHSLPMASSSKLNATHVDEDLDDLDGTGSDPSSTLIVLISDNRRSRAILTPSPEARCSC